MRVYSRLEEENIRDQALVADWIRSGFLNAEQEPLLQAGLTVTVRRTNSVLRAVLAFFTLLIIGASVGLTMIVLEVRPPAAPALLAAIGGICLGIAWLLAKQARLYRCGVEEAFAAMAVLFLATSIGANRWQYDTAPVLGVAALAGFGTYLLFGFRYWMVGTILLAGWVPFGLKEHAITERALSLTILAILVVVARKMRERHRGEIAGDDWNAAHVTAFGAFYVVLNLMISGGGLGLNAITSGPFYWCTYVLIWLVPARALSLGIRERDRFMIDAGALAALITLMTNKPYLGWLRQTWDPILLGIVLIGTAIGLRRWLIRAGKHSGFTPERLLESENRALAAAAAISVALPHPPTPQGPEPHKLNPGGGQSGGGGASGSF